MNNTIVFLHGFLGGPEEFQSITSSLVSNHKISCECLTIDLNTASSFSLELMAEYVKSTLDHRKISKAHFWGYSMGGRVLLELYRKYPELFLSLTLESTSPGIVDPKERDNRVKMDRDWGNLLTRDPQEFLKKWYSQVLFSHFREHPDFEKHLKSRSAIVTSKTQTIIQMQQAASPGLNPHHFNVIAGINIPTLVLVGQLDEKYLQIWTKLIDKNPNIAIKVIQNSGHVIHLEESQKATTEFEKFLLNIM